MLAHFVGGPLNGKERVLESNQVEVETYEFPPQPIVPSWESKYPSPESIEYHAGRYKRAEVVVGPGWEHVPAVFVWMDERPFRFVVEVDAVPGASREVARQVLEDVTAGLEGYGPAFHGGLKKFTVED